MGEAQILRDGELVIGRRFDLRGGAERWAEEERKHLENGRARLRRSCRERLVGDSGHIPGLVKSTRGFGRFFVGCCSPLF